jgi:hypothetical protein
MKFINTVIAVIKDEHGNIIHTQKAKNTITTGDPVSVENGLVYMLDRLFDNGDYFDPDDTLSKMQLGTGTPSNSGLGTPKTSPLNTMIAFSSVAFDTTGGTWYSAPKIIATAIWDDTYGALSGISEAGLFTTPLEYMFAYKTFSPALSKTALGSITIEWEIQASAT